MITKDLDRVAAEPPDYYWPEWEDFTTTGVYDPWDDYGVGDSSQGSGGDGGEPPPTMQEMRDYLQSNAEFNELSDRLKGLILQSEKLSAAVHDLLKQGIDFKPTNGTGYFDGVSIFVNQDALAGANSSDAAINRFTHEVGHYINGLAYGYNYANPNDYARARAEGEVRADMFMIEVSQELGITSIYTGTLSNEAANEVRNGTFDVNDFYREVNTNLNRGIGPGAGAVNNPPPDWDGDGYLDNSDLYLNSWVGPSGETYSQWSQGQPGGGGNPGGGGDGGGGGGGGGGGPDPNFPIENP